MARSECIGRLVEAGISLDDALALRRIAMTLHRWHELECGDSDSFKSVCLVRGRKSRPWSEEANARVTVFDYDDDGAPFLETHYHDRKVPLYITIPDRESGAKKRLAKIVARYPGFTAYVQTDPRGAALYIMRPGDVKPGDDVSSVYTRGVAVYK